MKREELDAIRKRAEAATPGPWKYSERDNVVFTTNPDYKYAVEIAEEFTHGYDAIFIEKARADVPALLAEVERLGKAVNTLVRFFEVARDHPNLTKTFIKEALKYGETLQRKGNSGMDDE